ncbi:tetratricopeptide repeat protein, partial [Limnofasciculus baicalensis]
KAYYLKALKIREDAGDFYRAASDYHNLGVVAEEKREFEEAISYFVKALRIFVDKEDFYKVGYPIRGLGRILKQIGESQFDTVWREVRGFDCTGDLREAIWAARDELDSE